MDQMQEYELFDILDNLNYTDRSSWEQTRIVAYFIAQKMCKKKLDPHDILPLPYDKNNDYDVELDREMIQKQAMALENILNKNNKDE